MSMSAAYGAVNVQGSFNRYFLNNYTGGGLPKYLSGVTAYFDHPEQRLTALPAFTVIHLGGTESQIAQGEITQSNPLRHGRRVDSMAEIDAWATTRDSVNSGRNPSAMIQVRAMRDMIKYLFNSARYIPILDIYGTTGVATAIAGAIMRVGDIEESPVLIDPNPSIRRIQMSVHYWYIERY